MRLHASLVAVALSASIATAGGAKTKAPAKKPKTVEVCPQLRAVTIVPFWEDEEVWTKCPVASPVLSVGGRCVDGTRTCMQPCSAKRVDGKGKTIGSDTYAYDKDGHLTAATLTSYFGDKSMETKYGCTYKGGHRATCKGLSGDTTYTYKGGLFTGTSNESAKTKVTYDKSKRVTATGWIDERGEVGYVYTYNKDGTLATATSKDPRMTVAQTFTYEGGRLTKLHTEPSGGGFKPTDITYTYDSNGRVTEETSTGQVAETVTYSYDSAGRLVKQVRKTSTNTYTQDYSYSCR